jgi:mono/diheme cytochrome c family protein
MFDMKAKYAKLKAGGANPYIDPAGCKREFDVTEAMFHAVLDQQKAASPSVGSDSDTSGAKAPAAAASAPAPNANGGGDALVAQGKERFNAYQCVDCHGNNGEGTSDAPDLTHSHLTAEQIAKFLQKPSTDAVNKGMPNIPADSPDSRALVAYVLSIRAK